MSKRKKKIDVFHMDSVENTLRHMPKFNPYATGHGVHQSEKYPTRAKRKRDLRKHVKDY